MSGFAKLDSGIVDSSIWAESAETRIVWITLLAKCDKTGYARLSVSGLQRASNIALKSVQKAIQVLEAPDTDSRTPDHEGRRIKKIDGGWHILNYEKYRNNLKEEAVREYFAEQKRKQREIAKDVQDSTRHVADSSASASGTLLSVPEGSVEGNHFKPTLGQAYEWLDMASTNGSAYTKQQCHSAWLAMNANGWMWGRNPVSDWRSALERQIQTDLNKSGGKFEKKSNEIAV